MLLSLMSNERTKMAEKKKPTKGDLENKAWTAIGATVSAPIFAAAYLDDKISGRSKRTAKEALDIYTKTVSDQWNSTGKKKKK